MSKKPKSVKNTQKGDLSADLFSKAVAENAHTNSLIYAPGIFREIKQQPEEPALLFRERIRR